MNEEQNLKIVYLITVLDTHIVLATKLIQLEKGVTSEVEDNLCPEEKLLIP